MRLMEAFGLETPLDKLSPQEKRNVDEFMKGGGDVQLDEPVEAKLIDFYSDEMPTGVQSGTEGTPDEWLFDKLQELPQYKGA
jgi:hypothetical protein